jgi:hypothetical protein
LGAAGQASGYDQRSNVGILVRRRSGRRVRDVGLLLDGRGSPEAGRVPFSTMFLMFVRFS